MKTLKLTSPLMSGLDVEKLQKLLRDKGMYKGNIDGAYGPVTAQAVYRAKHYLGYAKPDKVAGDLLVSYLSGKRKVTAAMAKRAKARAAAAKKRVTKNERIVQIALSQLGQTENPPNSNKSKFSTWYGLIGPWCAMFVTWVFCHNDIKSKAFVRGQRYAYCPFMVSAARAGQNFFTLAVGPANAKIAMFDWRRDGISDHTGICAEEKTIQRFAPKALAAAKAKFGSLGAGDFWCIEGNTSVGNDSNGGNVELRKRNRSQVQAFISVGA